MFRFLTVFTVLLLAAGIGGCAGGPSLNEFYTDRTVVHDNDLVGVWQELRGKDEVGAKEHHDGQEPARITITPAGQAGYLLTLTDDPAKAKEAGPQAPSFLITLFKVGDSLFADLTLSPDQKKSLDETYLGMIIVTHRVMRIELDKDRMVVRQVSEDFERHFTYANIGTQPNKPGKTLTISFSPSRVITDPSEKLQQGLLQADAAGCFAGEAVTYMKVNPK